MSKVQRFQAILRRHRLQSGIIQEEIYRTPQHNYKRLDALQEILNHIDEQIDVTNAKLKLASAPPDTSKAMDWNAMERDLVKHKYHIQYEYARNNRPKIAPYKFTRKNNAIKTKQQIRKEVARAKWFANHQKQQRLEKARVKQQAFRDNFYRQQAIPRPQRKTYNVYPRKNKYVKGMKCHGCGEELDDCEC